MAAPLARMLPEHTRDEIVAAFAIPATLPWTEASSARAAPLPIFSVDESGECAAGSTADLATREVLGVGGMGVVRLAEQRSLERDVAVKTIRLAHDAAATRALVREARITGGLEHPNIVPVHALGTDGSGAPVLVMKRIEGVSWRALIQDAEHPAWKPLIAGHGERLRAHVEILVQVCRALSFAHSRGVVHRDVKPDNVMIGPFGEVYLVDWGAALRLSESADEPTGVIVGTPGYMAPELVSAEPSLVGSRTDVYLLGACLYEVLTGRLPHVAPTPLAAMVAALLDEPEPLGEDAPRELAALVRAAMAKTPSERLVSAEAFREGLARHLAARELDLVLAEARAAVAWADEAIASNGIDSPDAYRALIEARFALATGLRARGDEEIRAALDACLVRMVEREIALRSPTGARALLDEMSVIPAALAARVEALERRLRSERAAAEEREAGRQEADSSRSVRAMRATVGLVSAVVVVAWMTSARASGTTDLGARAVLWMWAAALTVLVGAIAIGRRQILANAATRAIAAFMATMLVTPFGCTVVALFVGASLAERTAYAWMASAGVAMVGSLRLLPQIRPSVWVYLAGVVLALAAPEWASLVQPFVIATNTVVFVRALHRNAELSRVMSG